MSRVVLALVFTPLLAGALVACGGEEGERSSDRSTAPEFGRETVQAVAGYGQAWSSPLSMTMTVCGDGVAEGEEQCDDGNADDTDDCLSSCVTARCGDGFVYAGVEECDAGSFDGRGDTPDAPGDPCTATCEVPLAWTSVAPVAVIAGGCTTANGVRGRKIAVSSDGRVYVAALCGATAYVVASADQGVTYGAPVAIGVPAAVEVAVGTDPGGVVHVAVIDVASRVFYLRSSDGGGSWTTPVVLGAGALQLGVSIAAGPDDVWIAYRGSITTTTVLHGAQRGAGAFSATSLAHIPTEFDVMYDADSDRVLVASNAAIMHLFVSDDGGASFGDELLPSGAAQDWASGGGLVYSTSAGVTGTLHVIDLAAPSVATLVSALASGLVGQRVVTADPLGNAVVASNVDGAIVLDRVLAGETVMEPAVTVSASGAHPGVAALPDGTGAAVVYTDGGVIFAGVQVYSTSVSTETTPAHPH